MIPPQLLSPRVQLMTMNSSKKWDVIFALKLFFIIKRLNPQTLHLHSSILVFYTFFYSWFFKRLLIVQTIHNQITPAYIKVLRFLSHAKKIGVKFKHVVISKSIKRDFEGMFPCEIFTLIENGIFAEKTFQFNSDRTDGGLKRLMSVGHFGPAKRFELLADVFSNSEISSKFTLEIIGEEKKLEKPVTNYIKSKNIENIKLVGLKSNIREFLSQADALVIVSSFEGMPLVMLEALSVGCPVISTPVGGIPDVIVHRENGILSKGLSEIDVTDALLEFDALTKIELENIRKNNLGLFERSFGIEACAAKYEHLLSTIT